jgi:hypothetical protein
VTKRPIDLLILEAEHSLTELMEGKRPSLVDLAYHRVLKEWAGELTEDDRFTLSFGRLLAEAEINAMKAQAEAVANIREHQLVRRWAASQGLQWDGPTLNEEKKANLLFQALLRVGALGEARKLYDTEGKPTATPNRKDIADPEAFQKSLEGVFLRALVGDTK